MPNDRCTIATHWRPHFDELLAVAIKQIYDGEEEVDLVLVKDGLKPFLMTESGMLALERIEKEGVIFLGIGRGEMDDHGQDECAATLMAKRLGTEKAPELRRLLKFALRRDTKGGQPLDLDDIIAALHDLYPENPNKVREFTDLVINAEIQEAIFRECLTQTHPIPNLEKFHANAVRLLREETEKQSAEYGEHQEKVSGRIMIYLQKRQSGQIQDFDLVDTVSLLLRRKPDQAAEWIMEAVKAEITRQTEFHVTVKTEYEKNAREEIMRVGGAELKVAVIESGHRLITKYGLYKGAGVVVKRNPETGHVQIARSKQHTQKPKWRGKGDLFTLRDVVMPLRRAEQIANGIEPSSEIALSGQDGPKGAECWYYDPRIDIILNGSLTHPDMPATKLLFSEVERIVKETLKKA
ncbi:MAG: hypothetical protein HZC14_01635 [Candidatus Niyogibacteria bacterium]|nr:hypothetical protein [Candidatus Niyogibacteria bacterium]